MPASLLAAGLWLLVGCVYVPTWEYRTAASGPIDFRKYIGPAGSSKPIRPFHVTRSQVLALLGWDPIFSADSRTIEYEYEDGSGAWVWPLCFVVTQGSRDVHTVRLVFNRDDVLERVIFDGHDEIVGPLETLLKGI